MLMKNLENKFLLFGVDYNSIRNELKKCTIASLRRVFWLLRSSQGYTFAHDRKVA